MAKRVKKLNLNKETLRSLGSNHLRGIDSCLDSCYFVSCDGGCGISTGTKTE